MFNVMIVAADVIYKKAKLKLKKSRNLYSLEEFIHILQCYHNDFLSTKFGKYRLDLAIFLLKNMETTELINKTDIDETER